MNRKVGGGGETCRGGQILAVEVLWMGLEKEGPGKMERSQLAHEAVSQVDKDTASLCQMDRPDGFRSQGGAWRFES